MKLDIYDVVIAALLHDIGKIMQRSELPEPKKYLDRCPQYKDRPPSHLHVKWTEEFFVMHPYNVDPDRWQIITNLAASHHKPSAFEPADQYWLAQCLVLADRISSKWDRGDPDDYKREQYKKRPLYSIFDKIGHQSVESPFEKRLPLIPLSDFSLAIVKDPCNAMPHAEEYEKKTGEYRSLYQSFLDVYTPLMDKWNNVAITKEQFVNTLDSQMAQSFWCVPSNTNEINPTNSLYHHSKSTAAITASLFLAFRDKEKGTLNNKIINRTAKDFLLIGGDLSGIQNYIYDLNPEGSKFVSKTLRARSFKIKVLTDMVLHKIVHDLGITRQNILIDAGGKFMIIVPNNIILKKKLEKLRTEIDKEFFKIFQGVLSLNLDWTTEVSFNEIGQEYLPATVEAFMENLEKVKHKKYSGFLIDNAAWEPKNFILNTSPVYSDNLCQCCRRHHVDGINNGVRICNYCATDKIIGERLPKASYGRIANPADEESLISLFQGEIGFNLLKTLPEDKLGNGYYFSFNTHQSYVPFVPLRAVASHLPDSGSDKVLSFDDIADKAQGTSLNAVVKGDVDNLGLLFSEGLKDEKGHFSLTKYSTFSAMIDLFFSDYLPLLIKMKYPDIYIIYSGGDDFALIGPWNVIMDFVVTLHQGFENFTLNNPSVHFSAGIELLKGRQPIKHGISAAEELLKLSKEINRKISESSILAQKNQVTVFDTTVDWKLFKELILIADRFQYWLENVDGFSTQFLYRLFEYNQSYLKFKKNRNVKDLMYISHLNYDLNRNILNSRRIPDELKTEIKEFFGNLVSKDNSVMQHLKIPISVSLYNNR